MLQTTLPGFDKIKGFDLPLSNPLLSQLHGSFSYISHSSPFLLDSAHWNFPLAFPYGSPLVPFYPCQCASGNHTFSDGYPVVNISRFSTIPFFLFFPCFAISLLPVYYNALADRQNLPKPRPRSKSCPVEHSIALFSCMIFLFLPMQSLSRP